MKIDKCENVRTDRGHVNDLTIEYCSEESCNGDFRMSKNDIRNLLISLKFPPVMRLDPRSIIPSEKAS